MIPLLISCALFSQYFGQNKIQYKDFNYHILSTEHFDIYYYEGGEDIAQFAEDVLEDGYNLIHDDLEIDIEFKVPVILYNSPNDFSQTNVTLELIEESVGGFTEILKNRMVIPFNGDYAEFRHVLVHELTHVFEFVIFFPSKLEAMLSGDIFYSIPLWVMEGFAEFESQGWDLGTDIFMRDLVTNNKVVPLAQLGNYGGYLVYKQGQAFYRYVTEKYDRKKTGEFIHLLKSKKNLDATFLQVFGVSVEDFHDRWLRYYQMQYWPKIGLQQNYEDLVRVVYDHRKTNTLYNTSPAISPRGDKIAFISDRTGTADIILISSIDGHVIRRLVKAEYSAGYEGLHLYQGGLTWSPDEKYLAFAAKVRGEDMLCIVQARSGRSFKKLALDLDGIFNPCYAPDGRSIYISGLKDSYLDIYRVDLASGRLEHVTDDIYTDKYPYPTADGRLLFVSDRPDSNDSYAYGQYAVYEQSDGGPARLVPRTGYVASPIPAADRGFFFVADYDSAYNLYYYDRAEGRITKRTNIMTGCYYPTISETGDKVAFGYYDNYGYDICVTKEIETKMADAGDSIPAAFPVYTYEMTDFDSSRIKKYKTRFSLDYMVAAASYTTPIYFAGQIQVGVSDILGNNHFQIATNFNGSLDNSDIFLNYWYLARRPDYGVGLFHYLNYFADGNDLLIWRYLGMSAGFQYPLNRFMRVEFGLYGYKVLETRWHNFFPDYYSNYSSDQTYDFLYPDFALVFDNVRWGEIGPQSGWRARLEVYKTVFSDFNYISTMADYRKYFRLGNRTSFAVRAIGVGSFGSDEEFWTIGGGYSLRGYDYYTFTGSQLGFGNLEFRFPFIDRLKLSFPLPIEIRNIRGVLFADLGGVNSDTFRLWERTEHWFRLRDLHLGIGYGLHMEFLATVFKFDFGRAFDGKDFTDDWKFYFTIGPEW